MFESLKKSLSDYWHGLALIDVWPELSWLQRSLIPLSWVIDSAVSASNFAAILALAQSVEVIAAPEEQNNNFSLFGYINIDLIKIPQDPLNLLYAYCVLYYLGNSLLPRVKKMLLANIQSSFPQALAKKLNEKLYTLNSHDIERLRKEIKTLNRNINLRGANLVVNATENVYPSLINAVFGMCVVANLGEHSTINTTPIIPLLIAYSVVDAVFNFVPAAVFLDQKEYKEETYNDLYIANSDEALLNHAIIRLSNQSLLEISNAVYDINKLYKMKARNIYRTVGTRMIGGVPDIVARLGLIAIMAKGHDFQKQDIGEIVFLFRYFDLFNTCILLFAQGLRDARFNIRYVNRIKQILTMEGDPHEILILNKLKKSYEKESMAELGLSEVVVENSDQDVLRRNKENARIAIVDFPRYQSMEAPQVLQEKYFVFKSLEFKNVCFKYPGSKKYALEKVSFKINSGEFIALVGKSGSGKSTIVNLMIRLYRLDPNKDKTGVVDSGEILVNGKNILAFSEDELILFRKSLGIMPQRVKLFMSDSLKYNILYYCSDNRKLLYRMKTALKQTNEELSQKTAADSDDARKNKFKKLYTEKMAAQPNKKATKNSKNKKNEGNKESGEIKENKENETSKKLDAAYERALEFSSLTNELEDREDHIQLGEELSGGQEQRISFARLIAKRGTLFAEGNPGSSPEYKSSMILVLDEPTSALDVENELLMMESLRTLKEREGENSAVTMIIVTHRLSLAKKANKILVVDNKTVVEQDIHDALLKNDKSLYAKFWREQAQPYVEDDLPEEDSEEGQEKKGMEGKEEEKEGGALPQAHGYVAGM